MSYLTTDPIDLDIDNAGYDSSSSEDDNNLNPEENANISTQQHSLTYIGPRSFDMLALPSRPNIQNTKLLHKKSLRVLHTALRQTQFDPTGFRDEADNTGSLKDTATNSDRTSVASANQFKLNDDLPASEQQKMCTDRMINISETLATDVQLLLQDQLIEAADREKQIADLIAEFVSYTYAAPSVNNFVARKKTLNKSPEVATKSKSN